MFVVSPMAIPPAVPRRGLVRRTFRNEAVLRALGAISMVPTPLPGSPGDAGRRPIAYRLEGGFNGGSDPFAPHCADWSFGNRTPTADCIGFLLWSSGIDRKQPGYKGTRDEWLNCASLLDDADGAKVFCAPVQDDLAQPGDWLLTPDHCSMIIRPAIYVGASPMFDHVVVDCSPRHGRATAIGTGAPWSDACRVVRYKHYIQTI